METVDQKRDVQQRNPNLKPGVLAIRTSRPSGQSEDSVCKRFICMSCNFAVGTSYNLMWCTGDTRMAHNHNQSAFATPAPAPLEHGVRASNHGQYHHRWRTSQQASPSCEHRLKFGDPTPFNFGQSVQDEESTPRPPASMQRYPHVPEGSEFAEQMVSSTSMPVFSAGQAVRLCRKDAWARFLAYEVKHDTQRWALINGFCVRMSRYCEQTTLRSAIFSGAGSLASLPQSLSRRTGQGSPGIPLGRLLPIEAGIFV